MSKLLLLEQDPQANQAMRLTLQRAGHQVRAGRTVADGIRLLEAAPHQMTILNAALPWSESREFLRLLAEKGLPVLFLTAEKDNVNHLRAMYPTCCEVLVTPADSGALLEAVASLESLSASTLTFGALRMDTVSRRVTMSGRRLTLTAQEYELLHALMACPREAVTRERLLREAWGYQAMGITRTVDVHIQRLRRKLGAAWIETVYRTGYRLSPAMG
ncbi:MAG: response regulator transcription factor [Clostridia bacterium]|nr:response regulator transcription factor [Clostridia bacterium]